MTAVYHFKWHTTAMSNLSNMFAVCHRTKNLICNTYRVRGLFGQTYTRTSKGKAWAASAVETRVGSRKFQITRACTAGTPQVVFLLISTTGLLAYQPPKKPSNTISHLLIHLYKTNDSNRL